MAAFTAGDIVVYRVGDGSTPGPNGTAAPVFLDEYTASGVLVQSVALPTATNGANLPLTASNTAASEGLLTLSGDNRYLLLTGYDAPVGAASVAGTTSTADPRVVGRVDVAGSVNTTTALTDFASGNNPRGVASPNGTDLWVDGGAGGVRYTTLGSTTSTQLSTTTTNLRGVEIFGGQIYLSSSSGTTRIATLGTGEPTTAGQTITNLPGITSTNSPSPYAFYLADLSPSVAGYDTLYVADATNGLSKYSLVNGSWTANGSIALSNVEGLTASVKGATVTLFATTGSAVDRIVDTAGYNAADNGTVTAIATAGTNTAFRGVAFAPSVPPTLTGVTPAEGATGVATNASVQLTFSEAVKAGTGNISLTDNAGDVRTIAVTDATQVTFNGAVLKITPTTALNANDTYHVTFGSGVVVDGAGNTYAGLTAGAVDFSTAAPADTTPPTLSSATPAEGATGVATGAAVQLTFSEAVKAGTGTITLTDNAGDTRTLAVTDPQVAFNGAVVTITPTQALKAGDTYHVTFGSGVVLDLAGNPYAGLPANTVDFSTAAPADTTPPTLASSAPAEGATGVATNAAVTLTFSETVKAGSGTLTLTDNAGDTRAIAVTDPQVAFNGSVVTITPAQALKPGDTYHVTFGSGVVLDSAGNPYAGLPAGTVDFATAAAPDTTPPTLASTTPAENATGVATTGAIVLTFSEAVKAGTGNITLIDTADSSRNVTIAVGNAGQVAFSGSTVTIQPTAALHVGDTYRVSVDGTAVSDLAGNAYLGGADVLDFTTALPAGAFPTGNRSATFAITAPGTYTLPANQTFTETAAVVAVTAADTSASPTSLDIAGTLVGAGGQRGIVETAPNGLLTVESTGSLKATDADAFQFKQPAGGGHANVVNLGSIVSATTIATPNTAGAGTTAHGYGLNFNAAVGAAGAVDHTSGGTIANGSTTNATALIESDSDDAIRLGSNQTLTNYGQILGKGPVDDAASNNALKGGSTTNLYDSSRGVEINGGAHDTVDNFGRIEGAQHGVDAGDTADTDIAVINEAGGVIIGHNGSGVGSDGATTNAVNAADVTVTNSGRIYGEYHPTYDRSGAATTDGDGDGVDIDGAGTVVNKAGAVIAGAGVDANGNPVLNGQGAGGYDSNGRLNHSEGLSLGGGVVDNSGTISGADYGITVNNDSVANRSGVADTQITNEVGGTITGQNGYAIRLENKGSDGLDTDTITNHGTITGNGAIPVATGTATIEGGANDPNTVGTLNGIAYTAGGTNTNRFVSGDGSAIQTGEGNDTVFNDGVITGTNGRAISLEGGDDTLTLSAAGTVTGIIDGGVGNDTLNLTTGATGATTNTLTGVVNFEVLNVQKGAWTLTDAESYTTATISAGAALQLGTGGTTGAITAAVADSGTLVVDHSDAVTLGATVSGGGVGVLSQIGTGTTTLSAAHNFAGVTLAAGVLDVAATGATAAVTFAPSAGATPLLRVEAAAVAAGAFAPTVKGFAAGDAIDVTGVGAGATATLGANNVLTVSGATGTETLQLDPTQSFAGKAFATAGDAGGTGVNVTLTTAAATSGVLYSQTFDSYTASGLNPGGTGGALDSNVFRISGLNGPTTSNYGDTSTAADYARGGLAANQDPSSAGLYSGATANSGPGDHALMIQPTGAEFDVNGFVEMRVQNTTANAVTGLSLAFNWVYHNNEPRADDLALAYSTDGVNFTVVPSAGLNTPAAASTASPVPFTYTPETVNLPAGAVVAPGAYVYFRFEHLLSTGGGSRDEVGIDNVSVSYSGVSHTPVLSVSNVSANEGNSGTTPFTFTVTRAGDLSAATTVHYATADGTANAGSDYVAASGDLAFAPGDTTKTITVLVNGDTVQEPNETFTLNLSNPVNATLPTTPATGAILNDDVSVTSVGAIQGAATTSPFVGQTVTTTGVVTAIKTGSGGGYYIQDPTNAGPVGASHGLFVFTAATPVVAVGDAVTVSGVVTEYAAETNDRPTTELNSPTTTVTSHSNAVTPVIIGTGGLLPPTSVIAGPTYDPVHNGVDFYESLEGQLVTIHNAQATDATYSGSTWVVADLGAEATGMNARGGVTSSAGDFDPERIQVYSTALNATMGEHLGDITGVISYYNGEYELIPTTPVTPPANSPAAPPALPLETTTLKGDATHLAIAAYNVENLGPVEPGVAQTTVDARFAALGSDIAKNLGGPAIVGLEEIQDSNGENPNTPPAANDANYAADYAAYEASLSGSATLTKLTGAITAAGGHSYSYVEVQPTATNTTGGAPDGNIRTAILYDPSVVTYVAGSAHLIADPNLSDGDAFANSRMPLAAQFVFNGQTINVIEVHDYARSGSEELFGLDQPAVNSGDQRRIDQTAAVKAYVQQLQAADPNAKIVVQGDFNGFQFETTLTQLAHSGGGTLNQLSDLLPANERYSTTFEGISQEIDHALVSDPLDANAQFDIVHLNTGQTTADQASDHDPILSLLSVPGAAPPAPTNTPPAFGSLQATASAPAGGSVLLQTLGLTLTDPDAGASIASAQVTLGAGFTTGDRLTTGALPAGVTASFNASTGVLTLGGGSDADVAAALRTVGFTHDGDVTDGSRTVTFSVTDDHGATTTATETLSVAGSLGTGGGGGAGGATSPPTDLAAQQGYSTQLDNLLHLAASDPALSDPSSPLYAQAQAQAQIAARLDAGQISLPDAQNALYHLVDGTVSVAEITYDFFTGKTPTAAGLSYLVHSAANPTDLNDPYYAQFSTENRYINFSANLGRFGDSSTSAFHQAYDGLSLSDATGKAYQAIFGAPATADKVSAILNSLVPDGLGGTETRAQYFASYGMDGLNGIGTKSAMIGWLLSDSVKEGFGAYQQADLHFLADLAHGTAVYNVDLLAAYTQAPSLVGQPSADPTAGR